MQNIDEFNRLTLEILGRLYEEFPNEIFISVNEFYEDSQATSHLDTFAGTIEFLRREGYLIYESGTDEGVMFSGMQLTMRGLSLLERVPDSVSDGKSVGKKITDLVRSGMKTVGKEAITETVKMLFSAS